MKPESKSALVGILTYHVVAGNLDGYEKGGGNVVLTTVAGGKLTAEGRKWQSGISR